MPRTNRKMSSKLSSHALTKLHLIPHPSPISYSNVKYTPLNHVDDIFLSFSLSLSLSLSLFSYFFFLSVCFLLICGTGAITGSDHSRNNPYNNNNNNNYNNQYGHGNGYGSQSIDPNQIFGNPNSRPPQSNQPWRDLPIFAPNPTSGHGKKPQQTSGGIYLQAPNQYPSGGHSYSNGFSPPNQIPFAFGVPPPNSAHNIYPRPTTHRPSLLDQFLYNKQGGRRNGAVTMHANWQQSTYIIIFSICNILVGFILTARNYH